MKLSISEIKTIIDALEARLQQFEEEQITLDDAEEDRIADVSNDMYALEILLGRFQDEHDLRVEQIKSEYLAENHSTSSPQLAVGVAETAEAYPSKTDTTPDERI